MINKKKNIHQSIFNRFFPTSGSQGSAGAPPTRDEKRAHTAFRVSQWAEVAGQDWGGNAVVAEMDDRAGVPQTSPITAQRAVQRNRCSAKHSYRQPPLPSVDAFRGPAAMWLSASWTPQWWRLHCLSESMRREEILSMHCCERGELKTFRDLAARTHQLRFLSSRVRLVARVSCCPPRPCGPACWCNDWEWRSCWSDRHVDSVVLRWILKPIYGVF